MAQWGHPRTLYLSRSTRAALVRPQWPLAHGPPSCRLAASLSCIPPCMEKATQRSSTIKGFYMCFVFLWSKAKHVSKDDRAVMPCGCRVWEWSSMKMRTSILQLFFGSQDLHALLVWVPQLNAQENLGKQDISLQSSSTTWQNQTSVLTVQL